MDAVDEATADVVGPELNALIDELVPPPRRVVQAFIGILLVSVTVCALLWSGGGGSSRASIQASLQYPFSIDEERGLVGVSGNIVAFKGETVQIVDLAIDAPGADLVEFELRSGHTDSVALPFEVSQQVSLSDAIALSYIAWLEPVACEVAGGWGAVTVSYEDARGDQSQIETAPYNRFDAIPRELRPLGSDLLAVACEVLR